MGEGRGRTRANSVCFTKNWVKIRAFPNATLTSKNLEKFVSGQKRSKAVFSRQPLSRLTFQDVLCLLTWLSDLKMIGVFTS